VLKVEQDTRIENPKLNINHALKVPMPIKEEKQCGAKVEYKLYNETTASKIISIQNNSLDGMPSMMNLDSLSTTLICPLSECNKGVPGTAFTFLIIEQRIQENS
jgi:hypothetical protein